ncbi:hypothetical protein FB451DRAFT_1047454, partial [Mycena latifolia]
APLASTTIGLGESIAFNYADSNWCHAGYTSITMWLSEAEPSGLNATGSLPDGTYIEYFGRYLIANFGLSAIEPIPPANLTIPDISDYPSGSILYFTVVETAPANACPPVRAFLHVPHSSR